MSRQKAIGWCFTLNNYTEEETNSLHDLHPDKARYLIFGFEKGEMDTPHLQGYVEFHKQTLFSTVKKLIPRAHLEVRRGTAEQAIDYCKKDGVFTELGTSTKQGQRKDLDRIRQLAEESGMRTVTAVGSYQQIRTAEAFLTFNEAPRNEKPHVTWIYGESGSGKTKLAHEMCADEDVYIKIGTNKWWQGYDAHTHVIIDDFRPTAIPFVDLLGILDRYEFRVECKGSMRQLVATKFIITSIQSPQEMYKFQAEPIEQLMRRIDELINLNLKKEKDNIPFDDLYIDDFDLPFDALSQENNQASSSSSSS